MKTLKDILYGVSLKAVEGSTDLPVSAVHFDSRRVEEGSVFVAVSGTQVDGHQYIQTATEKGATSVVCEQTPDEKQTGVTYVEVANSAQALGQIAANFYDNPSAKLKLVAVTGTNGKTTVVTLLHQLFMRLGYLTGLLSTVNNKINEEVIPSTHTTPDAVQLNALLAEMVKQGCTHAFMEASSHAIVQHRMAGLKVAGAIFTNISHDHLDYHKTFEEYIKAKKKLFDDLPKNSFALVNTDDKRGKIMVQNTAAQVKTFSLKGVSDFKAKVLTNSLQGLELEISGDTITSQSVWFPLIGDFNAYNLLATFGAAVLLNEEPEEVLTQLSGVQPARGRFEQVHSGNGVTAIVDYSHTPDALKNVLKTIQNVRTKNETVICVVGCGGDRDKGKRPKMAAIAAELSDKAILTSDNPRSEDPEEIIKDMQAGVSASHYKKVIAITNRREAIKAAIMMAEEGDIILVAGKGHETYQEIKGVKHDFDDKQVLNEIFHQLRQR
ncbi:UDP-N-acetylmuramoyl-L-alanyl-D-glutamate--2,6-diaminopimelate ligase [Tunicatimonas pelagia]|uniref:UDP-N-acetylmuramoyl-L-alanyl-D-glutamate--2, 6-diaminopimelate ligase n=1 Tax=Tunicatimonas pelagia TaxID=931531 RepID=UPI0026671C33|nr:UDP-N-acetylmuramoyl-L-alanyl-D-glutamate--2,6-diaminopimelate ligase [Tunicatimonas pelagia]WKN41363.1 UDP-N-acetylmuramoyl-L-alanyl-D-glutamate--2,6-diaminopimelate ligase [Tunicatimonas pelagia]